MQIKAIINFRDIKYYNIPIHNVTWRQSNPL